MIVDSDRPPTTGANSSAPAARPWRWSLATLLLATALVAVWTGVWQIRQQNNRLRSEIKTMSILAHELIVDDPRQYAVVERPATWHGEKSWRVFLPPGGGYRIKLASRGIEGTYSRSFPAHAAQAVLVPGKHEIEYRVERRADQTWRLYVLVDGQVELELPEEEDWQTSGGATSTGGFSRSTQVPIDRPLVLKRTRFHTAPDSRSRSSTPSGVANGTLLWIETLK